MEKISIIIPIYNTEAHLSKCIESVMKQTYRNIEIVLVNDGSDDNSLEICKNYQNKDNRIKIINKKNGGVSSARMAGINNSSGEYIGFVDSDDYIDNMMYEILMRELKKYSAKIVECGIHKVYHGKIIKSTDFKEEFIENSHEITKGILKNSNTDNSLCNKLFAKEVFKNIQLPNYQHSEDYLTNIMISMNTTNKITIEKCLYYYNYNEDSATKSSFTIDKLDQIKVREKLMDTFKNNNYFQRYIAIDILKKIVTLSLDLERSNINNSSQYHKILKNKFEKYSSFIPIIEVIKVSPLKLKISLLLCKMNYEVFNNITKFVMKFG